MPETTAQITDAQLLEKLAKSPFEADLRTRLETAVPQMNDVQRTELLKVLDDTEKGQKAFDAEKLKKIEALNAEYDEEIKKIEHEEVANARSEFEKLDQEETMKEMTEVEDEIDVEEKAAAQKRAAATKKQIETVSAKPKEAKAENHEKRNFMMIIVGVVALVVILLIALASL